MTAFDWPRRGSDIAIIGYYGRVPGADSPEEFWSNIRDGASSIKYFSDEELLAHGVEADELADPRYVRAGAVLNQPEYFDATFFGITTREAEVMDPQQRLFLEVAWATLEHAGYNPETSGRVGVFVGARTNTYLLQLASNQSLVKELGAFQLGLTNDVAFLPTRVSHCFNLTGPSCAVQTACSTSLVTVHLAAQSLLLDECDMALAGGVAVNVPHVSGYVLEQGSVLSPDGRCRVFDAAARGTVFGSGVGAVLLKRLDDALADGDYVHAVIKGSAINNDGSGKASFTAPSVRGQLAVIDAALRNAQVGADTISYIEAHGTGTLLGDAIELRALTKAYAGKAAAGTCAVGSVKTNVGHLDAAAGVTGLIKVVESLKHGELVPSLHYETPNPQVPLEGSPFYVNTARRAWPRGATPRRAGVSAFGVGGTNAHVIVEEAPPAPASGAGAAWQVLVWSGKTAAAREQVGANLASYLRAPTASLADVAYTLQTGRQRMRWRRALVCRTAADAVTALDAGGVEAEGDGDDGTRVDIAFVLPGQGAQRPRMGQALYETEPVYRAALDRCATTLEPELGLDLRIALADETGAALTETWLAQPALFAVEYALVQLWASWGIRPAALLGHSLGEYVAACVAGVLTLEDAVRLVALRGRLAQAMPRGALLAVDVDASRMAPWLGAEAWVTAVNGPGVCTVGGTVAAVARVEAALREAGHGTHRLLTSHAFHTPLLADMVAPFVAAVEQVPRRAPQVPYISSVTGTWVTAAEVDEAAYWGRQLLAPVQFARGVETVLESGATVWLEVGPGQGLTRVLRRRGEGARAVASLQPATDDDAALRRAAAQLWVAGASLNWAAVTGPGPRRRVPLPTYPFQRQRYWIDAVAPVPHTDPVSAERARHIEKLGDVTQWFWAPTWRESFLRPKANTRRLEESWLVFADDSPLSDRVVGRLRQMGATVATVHAGGSWLRTRDTAFSIDADNSEHYEQVVNALADNGTSPHGVLHLWALAEEEAADDFCKPARLSSLLFATWALATTRDKRLRSFLVVSTHTFDVERSDDVRPEKSAGVAFSKILSQEMDVDGRFIDVTPQDAAECPDFVAGQLLDEIDGGAARIVALRGRRRWTMGYERIAVDPAAPPECPLRERGVYLITGGLGAAGLLIAQQLAETCRAKLLLVGRTPVPPRDAWPPESPLGSADDGMSRTIAALGAIEAAGGEVRTLAADVTDAAAMRRAIDTCVAEFGRLHGIIHAAGITSGPSLFRTIGETTPDHCREQALPKLRGLAVIEDAVRNRPIDFVLAMSSNAAVLGGLGFLSYAAANGAMDAFVLARSRRPDGPRWISVNWDHWPIETRKYIGVSTSMDEYAMTVDEARRALHLVLTGGNRGQIVAATADLQRRLDLWLAREEPESTDTADETPKTVGSARPRLRTPYIAPRNALEMQIAAVWEDFLSVSPVGVDDDYFELGGHSLIAVKMIAEISRVVGADVPLRALFEAPTVGQLAAACGSLLDSVNEVAAGPAE